MVKVLEVFSFAVLASLTFLPVSRASPAPALDAVAGPLTEAETRSSACVTVASGTLSTSSEIAIGWPYGKKKRALSRRLYSFSHKDLARTFHFYAHDQRTHSHLIRTTRSHSIILRSLPSSLNSRYALMLPMCPALTNSSVWLRTRNVLPTTMVRITTDRCTTSTISIGAESTYPLQSNVLASRFILTSFKSHR